MDLPLRMAGFVRRLAWQLAASQPFPSQDFADCEQDLWLRLFEAWPSFDPVRGSEKRFARVVLLRAARAIERYRRTRKSRISEVSRSGTGLPESVQDPQSGCLNIDSQIDFEILAESLSPALRSLIDQLASQTLAAIARDRGVPRSTLQRRVGELRRHFAVMGSQRFAPTNRDREGYHGQF